MCYLCSENNGTFAKTKGLIKCAFVFPYVKSRFSHDLSDIKARLCDRMEPVKATNLSRAS